MGRGASRDRPNVGGHRRIKPINAADSVRKLGESGNATIAIPEPDPTPTNPKQMTLTVLIVEPVMGDWRCIREIEVLKIERPAERAWKILKRSGPTE